MRTSAHSTRGILNPTAAESHFALERLSPAPDLAMFLDRHWVIHWDLRGRSPFEQETIPWPCVNMVFGTHRPGVFGVMTKRFEAQLDGLGWVVGTKFRPGGFRPFVDFPIADLTDRETTAGALFGESASRLDEAVAVAPTDRAKITVVEAFLRARRPAPDPEALEAARIADLAMDDPSITSVAVLSERAGFPLRALQRLFRAYVGVSPKWVIRRFRVHEAAERLKSGASVDAAALAQDCGYFDQAHFIRDFKAQVGRTPGEYSALCRDAALRRRRSG